MGCRFILRFALYCHAWSYVSYRFITFPAFWTHSNYSQRGLNAHSNLLILSVLYMVFFCTSALLALEVAQLAGLVEMLLQPNDSSTEAKFNTFYALIARETKITGVLFECQVSHKSPVDM